MGEVIPVEKSLKKITKKYPNALKNINYEITNFCKKYSTMSSKLLEAKYGFEEGIKEQFVECIKDTVQLKDTNYGKYDPKEAIKNICRENKITIQNTKAYEGLKYKGELNLVHKKINEFLETKPKNGYYFITIRNPNTKTEHQIEIKYEGGKKTGSPEIPEEDIDLIWDKELQDYELEEKEWLIQDYIPSKSVGIWTGKRGSFKTFLVLHAAYSVASGEKFLGRFKTNEGKVIYLDKENGIYIMKDRTKIVKKGMGVKDAPIGFICFSQLKLDRLRNLRQIEDIIEREEPKLLVIDTYRRAITFEENDAGEVSKLFVDSLRPLVEQHNVSIILIHHDRKGQSNGDEMDMIRGSSDLANYADFILKNQRKGKNIILKQLKMRQAPEVDPQFVTIDSNQNQFIKFKSQGNYENETEDERCAKEIAKWIINNKIKKFKTKQAKKIAFNKGVSKTNFYNALQELIDQGIIIKNGRGKYKVIKTDIQIEL